MHKNRRDSLPYGLEHYYDPNNLNQTINYSDSTGTKAQISSILCDTDTLLALCCSDYDDITEYQLFIKCLPEQTIIEDSVHRLRQKGNGIFSVFHASKSVYPDTEYRGYVTNLEGSVGKKQIL